jgi:hypothetical protein
MTPRMKHEEPDKSLIILKKTHLVLAILAFIVTPAITAFASYLRSQSSVDVKFAESKLDTERNFAKKDDVRSMVEKINQISTDVSEIKGYLKKR